MSNESLDHWLDHFCNLTKKAVSRSDSFTDMVFVVRADEISINGLLPVEGDDMTASEKLELFYGFGQKLAGEIAMPDFVVTAQLLQMKDSQCIMVLHGCSQSKQQDHRAYFVEVGKHRWIPWKRRLYVKEDTVLAGGNLGYQPALEVLRGLVASATSGGG